MSWQDVMGWYQEQDDEPARPTIPEQVAPGKRFMEKSTGWSWDVFDWGQDVCPTCMGRESTSCPHCQGSGLDASTLGPDLIVAGLEENLARLLVFGPEAITALEAVLNPENYQGTGQPWPRLLVQVRDALTNLKGGKHG